MKYSLPRVAPLALACAAAMSPVFAVEVEPGLRSEAESNGSVGTLIVLQAKAPASVRQSVTTCCTVVPGTS